MIANEYRNKNGQVRRKPIRDALDAILARSPEDPLNDKPKTIAQEIALSLVREAREGKVKAREELIDRTEGKPAQSIEHSGMIAATHEELLKQLDNQHIEDDDSDGEGDTAPSEG
jgi:hypothetical protein